MAELVAVHLAHRDVGSRFTVSDLLRRYAETRFGDAGDIIPCVMVSAAC